MSATVRKHVVVIGGGTGTHTVLTGLKRYHDHIDLTAIVAMTDSGGSTGRLRDEFGYLPVGDVRMALAALAYDGDTEEALIRRLFLHRFDTQGTTHGHNFGNLFLVALTDILGSEEAAIEAASRVLRVRGTVLPVTSEHGNLVAEYDDGVMVIGEHVIDEPERSREGKRITALSIEPRVTLHPKAYDAIAQADLVVLGPGDLYTSILANCVVEGFRDALSRSSAKLLYVAHLMTKRGQTDGMHTGEALAEIEKHTGRYPGYLIVNTAPLPIDLVERYAVEREYPVCHAGVSHACTVIQGDFLAKEEVVRKAGDVLRRSLIRHDPHALASAVVSCL